MHCSIHLYWRLTLSVCKYCQQKNTTNHRVLKIGGYHIIGGMETFDIARRMKDLRLLCGLTQEEFAEHAEIAYKFYQHLESGRKRLIRIDTIMRLAKAYNLELWEFFYPKLPAALKIRIKKNINSSPHYKKRRKK